MYAPGTFASATVRGLAGLRVMAVNDGASTGWISAVPVFGFTFHPEQLVLEVAPLTVAQADDAELDLLRVIANGGTLDGFERETVGLFVDRLLAGRALPKPPEPTARGSVVIDDASLEWVRVGPPTDAAAWAQHETDQTDVAYFTISAVQVVQ